MLARDPGVLDGAAPDLPHLVLALLVLEQSGPAVARLLARRLHQVVRLVLGLRAILGQQPGAAVGQFVHARDVLAVLGQVVQHAGVEALQPDQPLGLQQSGHMIGGGRGVGVPDDEQGVMRRVRQQPDLRHVIMVQAAMPSAMVCV